MRAKLLGTMGISFLALGVACGGSDDEATSAAAAGSGNGAAGKASAGAAGAAGAAGDWMMWRRIHTDASVGRWRLALPAELLRGNPGCDLRP